MSKNFRTYIGSVSLPGRVLTHLYHIGKVSHALLKVASGALYRITNGTEASTALGTNP